MLVSACMYSGLVGELPFVARVALLACFGGLAFVVCAFGGFLLSFLLAYAFLRYEDAICIPNHRVSLVV